MDSGNSNKLLIWKIIALILLVCLITIIILYSLGVGWKDDDEDKSTVNNSESILTLWESESSIIQKLVPYIKSITDKNSIDFIPIEDRIAVFDLDGTLFCETDPIYFDWYMYTYRVLEDMIIKTLQLANAIREANIHALPEGMEKKTLCKKCLCL